MRRCIIASIAFIAAAWVAALAVPHLPGEAPLIVHYTTTFGVDALGDWWDFVRLPLTGTVLVALNVTLARILTSRADGAPSAASVALVVASVCIAWVVCMGTVLLWSKNLVLS